MSGNPTMKDYIEVLRQKRRRLRELVPAEKIDQVHRQGRLTARERVEALVDKGTFVEQYAFAEATSNDFGMEAKKVPGDGAIVGHGELEGRVVYLGANDSLIMGGSGASSHIRKLAKTIDLAARTGRPYIQLTDCSGGRIQEGLNIFSYAGSVFHSHTQASGVVPQIAAILGRCAGFGVYGPALMDFIFVVEGSGEMFITGPNVLKEVTGEEITFDALGGAKVCTGVNGVADFRVADEEECFREIRRLLSFLPSSNRELPPLVRSGDDPDRLAPELEEVVPANPNRPFDMLKVIRLIVDDGEFMEVKKDWARNIIVGFGRFDGQPVGIVANQPSALAGTLTIDSSDKSSRFVRFCDAFNLPLIFLVDTPGYLPGVQQEHGGIIRHGAKLLHAYSEATVPKITVVVRKCYGGGHSAMAGHKEHGTDMVFAWPTAEFAIMGAYQAVKLLYRRKLAQAEDPEAFLAEKMEEYRNLFANPYRHASTMCLDDVIEPAETRLRIIRGLRATRGKQEPAVARKHSNIPM